MARIYGVIAEVIEGAHALQTSVLVDWTAERHEGRRLARRWLAIRSDFGRRLEAGTDVQAEDGDQYVFPRTDDDVIAAPADDGVDVLERAWKADKASRDAAIARNAARKAGGAQ
jgi:hypothetical protein